MTDTVWDYQPDLPTPPHDPVSGKLDNPGGGGVLGGVSLGVFADLAVNIGSLVSRLDRQQADHDRRARSIPGDYQYATGGIYPASGNLALNLGSPDQGQFWQIRRLAVGGSDITTTPTGTVWVFVQGSAPNQNGGNPSIAQAAWSTAPSTTLPWFDTFGTHQLVLDETEYLWVVITGGTSGTQYVASVKAETTIRDASVSAFVSE